MLTVEAWQRKHDLLCMQQHSETLNRLKWQDYKRATFAAVTMGFVYANGIHAPKWLFDVLQGIFQ